MERKIGEIFEYNGEWYQCVESQDGSCKHCYMNFEGKCPIPIKECTESGRSDKSYVIFKKLEKVGEPCEFQKRTIQTYKLYTEPFISVDMDFIWAYVRGSNTIDIIIKQNKEDMEEIESVKAKDIYEKIAGRKIPCLVNDRDGNLVEGTGTVCGYKGKWVVLGFDSTYEGCIGSFTDTVYIDKLFQSYRFWNVKHINIDVNNIDTIKLKPFSLKSAKEGKPVCTRDGRKARIICFDRENEQPIVALIKDDEKEYIDTFFNNGHSVSKINEVAGDLMMLSEKRSGWVNIDWDCNAKRATIESEEIYNTKEDALRNVSSQTHKDTVKIEWEE